MAVRNCAEIGENLQNIVSRLLTDQVLVKLLYYTDRDPLSGADLTQAQIQNEVWEKLIKVGPHIGTKETSNSIVAIKVESGEGNKDNEEFRTLSILIDVMTPLTQWMIKDSNLRPFKILGEVQKTLNKKTVNGLGKLSGGDFNLVLLTDEVSMYEMKFEITTYE
jgi:hypothetical protein